MGDQEWRGVAVQPVHEVQEFACGVVEALAICGARLSLPGVFAF